MYHIQHINRVTGEKLWWRPNSCGYTTKIEEAGLYTAEDATAIERIRGDDFRIEAAALSDADEVKGKP